MHHEHETYDDSSQTLNRILVHLSSTAKLRISLFGSPNKGINDAKFN